MQEQVLSSGNSSMPGSTGRIQQLTTNNVHSFSSATKSYGMITQDNIKSPVTRRQDLAHQITADICPRDSQYNILNREVATTSNFSRPNLKLQDPNLTRHGAHNITTTPAKANHSPVLSDADSIEDPHARWNKKQRSANQQRQTGALLLGWDP